MKEREREKEKERERERERGRERCILSQYKLVCVFHCMYVYDLY